MFRWIMRNCVLLLVALAVLIGVFNYNDLGWWLPGGSGSQQAQEQQAQGSEH